MKKPKERLVSDGFMSKYKTISQALEAANDGDVIRVKPGVYQEVLFIDKSVLVTGDRQEPGEVIIEVANADCIKAENTLFQLHNLTIRQSGHENFALTVTGSQFVITNCIFSSSQGAAVGISNCFDFSITNSRIENCLFNGMQINNQSNGSMKNCTFSGIKSGSALWVRNGSSPAITDCTFNDMTTGAITIENSSPALYNCKISGLSDPKGKAVYVNQGHRVTFKGIKISNSKGHGIHFENGASGILKNCRIEKVDGVSLAFTNEHQIHVEKAKIQHAGKIFFDNTSGKMSDCNIHHIHDQSIVIHGGNPSIHKCSIHEGKKAGILFDHQTKARMENCDIWGFTDGAAVAIDDASDPAIKNCTIHDGHNGIVVLNHARGEIDECKIYNFPHPGIGLQTGGNPTILNSEVYNCQNNAVIAEDAGKGRFENCIIHSVHDESSISVSIAGKSETTFINTSISNGAGIGIEIRGRAKALIENCFIHNFAKLSISVKKAELIIKQSKIYQGENSGIGLSDARATIEACKLYDFQELCIGVFQNSKADIRNTNVSNAKFGIGVGENSSANLQYTIAKDISESGIAVQERSEAAIEHYHPETCLNGLFVEKNSKASLVNAWMTDFEDTMVITHTNSSLDISNCRFSKGGKSAILLQKNAYASLKDCQFSYNRQNVNVDDSSRFEAYDCESIGEGEEPGDNSAKKDFEQPGSQEKESGRAEEDNWNDSFTDENFEIHQELNQFVGLTNIKESIIEKINLLNIAKKRRELGLENPFDISLDHIVFYGNPGTGKTSVARIFGKIFKTLGLLEKGHVVEVGREQLVGQYRGHTEEKTAAVIEKAHGGILFIDEAYNLAGDPDDKGDFGRKAIDTLLPDMENNRGKYICIVAGYEDEMQTFLNSNPGLASRFKEYYHFEDYTPDELMEISNRTFKKYSFHLEDDAKELLYKELTRIYRKRDKKFGNARTANDYCNKIIKAQATRLSKKNAELTNEALVTIKKEDVDGILSKENTRNVTIPINQELLTEHLGKLNGMVGLKKVKQEVEQLIELVRYYKEENRDPSTLTMHILLTGNPGTGKTEVAKILGGIYEALGILETGVLIEVDRDDLIDKYYGGTEEKVNKVIEKAIGGTLFIDEAYTLTNKSENDPGHIVVEMLLKEMEDNRGKFVVLAAGYEEEMEEFLNSNKGLNRRFDRKLVFEDYTPEEILKITKNVIEANGYNLTEEAISKLTEYYEFRYKNRDRTYGNAGLARKVAFQAMKNLDYRLSQIPADQRTEQLKVTIEQEDLNLSPKSI